MSRVVRTAMSRVVTKPWVWTSEEWVQLEIWWSQTSVTQFSHRVIPLWFSYWLCMLLGASEQKRLPPPTAVSPSAFWALLEQIGSHLPPTHSYKWPRRWGLGTESSQLSWPSHFLCVCMCAHVHTHTGGYNACIDLICMKGVNVFSPKNLYKSYIALKVRKQKGTPRKQGAYQSGSSNL